MNLSPRELATLAAALLYWREEMTSHGRWIMLPYMREIGAGKTLPLNRRELARLPSNSRTS